MPLLQCNITEGGRLREMEVAYFISPEGENYPIAGDHIAMVVKNPGLFGLTAEKIQQTYRKYGELTGRKGKARAKILLSLIKKGWIRIRHFPDSCWLINVARYDEGASNVLQIWAVSILTKAESGKIWNPGLPVKIYALCDGKIVNCTLCQLSQKKSSF